jgi:Mce-associated membrane protein
MDTRAATDAAAEDVRNDAEEKAVEESADSGATDSGATDSELAPEDDPAPEEDPAPRTAKRWLISVAALVVVLVAALVVGLILLLPVLDYRDVAGRRDAILAVARDAAQRSYSLDYESFPQESGKLIAQSTGNYRQGLIDASQGLQHILTQGKVKSTCVITAAGIERDDENTATVLLSITSSVTNTEIQTPQIRYYRVAINLIRQGDQWLIQSNDVIA